MSKKEVHVRKYRAFRDVAFSDEMEDFVRVANLFDALFQLIEACAATKAIHIQHHAEVARVLRGQADLFGDRTETVISGFTKIEREFRVGCEYGGSDGTKEWQQARPLFEKIEALALPTLGENR
ncbi:MAG TPA: hypothetical protein VI895_14220 [Bdellovibrionota bacterium]|nr:hypothetical protein [Bdellovibrionota bacterium]